MSLFRVYVDGALFYHPQISKLAITDARIEEDAENIDSMTLSAPFNHPYLSSVRPLASTIVCKKGDTVVFEGRALDNGTDFYNTHTWTCESCLAYLKDSIQPPYDYKGTLRGLLELFVSVHNNTVEEKKRFVVGNVTVTDNNDYVSYSSIDFTVTLDAIRDKLIKTHGGFLRVRYAGGVKYLDYIADFDSLSPQTVEYGKNLLDVKISRDHTDRVSVLLPLGAKIKDVDAEGQEYETDERVQITSVNGGKNYIVDEEAVAEIGMIWKTEIWDDVTVPGNLLTKARTRLHDLAQGVTSMELTIVDESDTGADIGDIHAGMYVICKSPPHGIDGRYRCVGRTRDYLNPAGNTITIGASGVTLTGLSNKQNDTISALEEDIVGQSSKIDVISGQVDKINESKMYRTELVTEGVSIFREKTQRSLVRCKRFQLASQFGQHHCRCSVGCRSYRNENHNGINGGCDGQRILLLRSNDIRRANTCLLYSHPHSRPSWILPTSGSSRHISHPTCQKPRAKIPMFCRTPTRRAGQAPTLSLRLWFFWIRPAFRSALPG